jgi:hypothetical protein
MVTWSGWRKLLAISVLSFPAAVLVAGGPGNWTIVGNDASFDAIEPLVKHREAEAFFVRRAETMAAVAHDSDYVLILGDEVTQPPERRPFYRWMSRQLEDYATDLHAVDWDGDGLPDIPVGRLPSSDPALLRSVAEKIVGYESRPASEADLGLPVWSGTPAYGKLLDEIGSFMMLRTLAGRAPDWAERWVITGNTRETLSAFPNAQAPLFAQRLGRGGAIAALMGHGWKDGFLSWEANGKRQYFRRSDVELMREGEPAPPTFIFACDCGDFRGGDPSLAEAMLYAPGGPVASVAATTQSHPLTNYYSGNALLDALSADEPELRFGDFWNKVQRDAFHAHSFLAEKILAEVEGKLENTVDIPRLKADHALMYALFGDPATLLRLPRALHVEWKKSDAGDSWEWEIPAAMREQFGESATLAVSLRAPVENLPRALPANASEEDSLRLFNVRNAGGVFQPRATVEASSRWVGKATDPGDYRFAVLDGQRLFVAVRKAGVIEAGIKGD